MTGLIGKHAVLFGLLAAGLLAGPAIAEPRLNPTKMTCAEVRTAIHDYGAVTLRYSSPRIKNLPLYNRYVRSSRFCAFNKAAVPASVPTRDRRACPVKICDYRDIREDRDFPPYFRF